MGLPPMSPTDNVIGIIVVNTAIAISIFKSIIQRILHIFGIHLSSLEYEPMVYYEDEAPKTRMDEFREQVPAIRFDSVFNYKNFDQECLVCLTRFRRYSVINHLCCGHVFHKGCLEKWLDCSKFTCPHCRTSLVPEDEEHKKKHFLSW